MCLCQVPYGITHSSTGISGIHTGWEHQAETKGVCVAVARDMQRTFVADISSCSSSSLDGYVLDFAPFGIQNAELRRVAHFDLACGRLHHGQALP